MAKKKIDQLKSSEEKYQTLIAKRNERNEQAFAVRDERNALNDKKKELFGQLKELRAERRELSEKIGEHKAKRNELQTKAKSMIEMKRKLLSSMKKNTDFDLSSKKHLASKLEMEHQTVPLSLEKEAELLKRIRDLYGHITQLEDLVKNQKVLRFSIEEIDQTIDDAFRVANSEHQHLLILVEERKSLDERIGELLNEKGALAAIADKKHEEYLEIKGAADKYHAKAKELREKILEIRAERRREREEQRIAVEEQNKNVERELLDAEKIGKAADNALQKLLSKGKVNL